MVLEPVTSSKAGTIRSLLIRAWRERWSDLQWGIHIKTVSSTILISYYRYK